MGEFAIAAFHRYPYLLVIVAGAMVLEYLWYRRHARAAYDLKETAATAGIMAGQIVLRVATAGVILPVLLWAQDHRLATVDMHAPAAVAGLFLVSEFTYYWFHRFSHEARWLWATHRVHHSSTHINFPAAYRLGWTNLISGGWLFHLAPILMGFPVQAVIAMFAANLAFQFFLHTERIGSLGPLEWVLNTPRHHCVHHARNPSCLDKNYGGVLIVFDRLFGTFAEAPKNEALRFGLVHETTGYNPFNIAFGEWIAMAKDFRSATTLADKFRSLFAMPEGACKAALAAAVLLACLPVFAVLAPQPAAAQESSGRAMMWSFIRACGRDYRNYCRDVPRGGGRVLACLQQHQDRLSQSCRTELDQMNNGLMAREAEPVDTAALPHGTRILKDFAYGADPAQRLDVYAPADARDAAIIVMLHGGAWAFGDKAMKSVVQNKAEHFLPEGMIFVSVDTRLLPAASPLQQAHDMARALAAVQSHARQWGGDPARIVLMGHSAGAHIVALLTAAPDIAQREGARPWRATVSLDSAALNVPALMQTRHFKLYDRAFGDDRTSWRQASPYQRLTQASVPILLVCSTRRTDSCPQAKQFAKKDRALGARAEVLPEDMSHLEINRDLGLSSAYTGAVDRFLTSVGLP